jgi:hypothetical protein
MLGADSNAFNVTIVFLEESMLSALILTSLVYTDVVIGNLEDLKLSSAMLDSRRLERREKAIFNIVALVASSSFNGFSTS